MMSAPFKGLHRVQKRLSNGKVATYYYAWRGGPRIEEQYGTPEFANAFAAAHRSQSKPESGTFSNAISDYLASAKFAGLAPSTKKEYRRLIDIIRDEFGAVPLEFFNETRMRRLLYNFRDRFSATKRKADYLVSVLSAILSYLKDQSMLDQNVALCMDKIYKPNRSEIIWTDDEIDKVCEQASDQLEWTIRLEASTGMRMGDLINVPWTAVQPDCIDWQTEKNDVDVFIPLTSELRSLLDEIPKVATTIVTNTKNRPWTKDGLKTMWGRAMKQSGVEGKHFHDLRGTAATKLCLFGLSDNEIAAIIGWKPGRVAEIRARYVDREIIIQGVVDRIEKNKDRTETVNRGVNRVEKRKGNDG